MPKKKAKEKKPVGPFGWLYNWGSFVKFSHTLFALPFAIASMALASRANYKRLLEDGDFPPGSMERGWPGWKMLLLILAAMVTARTCAMAFNRIVDRKFDEANPRTRKRHLPAGKISLFSAWTLTILSAVGFVACAWGIDINRDVNTGRILCLPLAPVALFFILFYSLTKRITHFTHIFLGIALAIAPVGAWLAITGSFGTALPEGGLIEQMRHSFFIPATMAVLVFFWLIGFDIIYAIQDHDFDKAAGLKSLVVRWGPENALNASLISHMIMLVLLAFFGILAFFKLPYWIGLFIIIGCLGLEHWIVRKRSLEWAEKSFFKLNAVISMVFLAVVMAEVMLPDFWSFRGY